MFLNYGKGNNIFEYKVEFPEILDLSDYSNTENTPKVFKLTGVVTHKGINGDCGHYIAYCRHFNGDFRCFDDKNTYKTNIEECKKDENLNYVLIYEKM